MSTPSEYFQQSGPVRTGLPAVQHHKIPDHILSRITPGERDHISPEMEQRLLSSNMTERAQAIGELNQSAPEFVFLDPQKQELFLLEREKIALRSMEHAQAGRAFNDFKPNLSYAESTVSSLLTFDVPPRAQLASMLLSFETTILFDAFHYNIERPYCFLPPEGASDPEDFSKGAALLEQIVPMLSAVEYGLKTVGEVGQHPEQPDLSSEDLKRIISDFSRSLSQLTKEWNLSDSRKNPDPVFYLDTLVQALPALLDNISHSDIALDERQMMQQSLVTLFDGCSAVFKMRYEKALLLGDDAPFPPETVQNAITIADQGAQQSKDFDVTKSSPQEKVFGDKDFLDLALGVLPNVELAREIARDRVQFASGQMELSEINLSEIIRTLPAQVLPKESETLILEIPEEYDVMLVGNDRRLRGAISNIVSNAFHYGTQLTVRLSFDEPSGKATMTFTDNGKGVMEELLEPGALPGREKIFDLGVTKREKDSTDGKKGTGVGTTETLHIIQMHDGTLSVSSIRGPAENQGTTFTATLPAKAVPKTLVGLSTDDFIKELAIQYGAKASMTFQEACNELPADLKERVNIAHFALSSIDPQSVSLFRPSQSHIEIPAQLMNAEATESLKLYLRDFLLPLELDRLAEEVQEISDPLVQQGILLLRFVNRAVSFNTSRRNALIDVLSSSEFSSTATARLADVIERTARNDLPLPARLQESLSLASLHQQRPLALRDPETLLQEIFQTASRMEQISVDIFQSEEMQKEIGVKLKVLKDVFGISEGTPFCKIIDDAAHGDTNIPLRPYHLLSYPRDSQTLLVYLLEHGLLRSVLSSVDQDEIPNWKVNADKVLPLAFAAVLPETFESLLHEAETRPELKRSINDLSQLPFLPVKRYGEIYEYLAARDIKPLERDAIEAIEAEKYNNLKPWHTLLGHVSTLFEPIMNDLFDRAADEQLLNNLNWLVQASYVQTAREALEVLSAAKEVAQIYAADIAHATSGQSGNKQGLSEALQVFRQTLDQLEHDPKSPLHYENARQLTKQLVDGLESISSSGRTG